MASDPHDRATQAMNFETQQMKHAAADLHDRLAHIQAGIHRKPINTLNCDVILLQLVPGTQLFGKYMVDCQLCTIHRWVFVLTRHSSGSSKRKPWLSPPVAGWGLPGSHCPVPDTG